MQLAKREVFYKVLVAIVLVCFCTLARIAPHPDNFAPIAAVSIFSAFYFRHMSSSWAVSLSALVLSDLWLGTYKVMPWVYGSFLLIGLLGKLLQNKLSVFRVFATSLSASLLFFLLTNFGEWWHSPLYEKSMSGLLNSYVSAIPYFWNTLAGDLFYTTVLFGVYAALSRIVRPLSTSFSSR